MKKLVILFFSLLLISCEKSKKETLLNDLKTSNIKNIHLYNIPNQDTKALDSLVIENKDSITKLFTVIKNAEEEYYAHPSIKCEMLLSIHLKNNDRLDFKILNTDIGTLVVLLSNLNQQEEIKSYRNYKSTAYISFLYQSIFDKNLYKNKKDFDNTFTPLF